MTATRAIAFQLWFFSSLLGPCAEGTRPVSPTVTNKEAPCCFVAVWPQASAGQVRIHFTSSAFCQTGAVLRIASTTPTSSGELQSKRTTGRGFIWGIIFQFDAPLRGETRSFGYSSDVHRAWTGRECRTRSIWKCLYEYMSHCLSSLKGHTRGYIGDFTRVMKRDTVAQMSPSTVDLPVPAFLTGQPESPARPFLHVVSLESASWSIFMVSLV